MSRLTLLIASVLLAAPALALLDPNADADAAFLKFVKDRKRDYGSDAGLNFRRNIFRARHRMFAEVNGQKNTFTVGVTEFADYTDQELSRMTGSLDNSTESTSKLSAAPAYKAASNDRKLQATYSPTDMTGLPTSADWSAKGFVTSVKNQGQCGSCTNFASAALLEAFLLQNSSLFPAEIAALSVKGEPNIAEQQLVDCARMANTLGCDGNHIPNSIDYAAKNALSNETNYPYIAADASCIAPSADKPRVQLSFTSIALPVNNPRAIIDALSRGPVASSLDIGPNFQHVTGGVYASAQCANAPTTDANGNPTPLGRHAVLLVGYDLTASPPFLKFKNSWGTTWGTSGFFKIDFNPAIANGPCNFFTNNIIRTLTPVAAATSTASK